MPGSKSPSPTGCFRGGEHAAQTAKTPAPTPCWCIHCARSVASAATAAPPERCHGASEAPARKRPVRSNAAARARSRRAPHGAAQGEGLRGPRPRRCPNARRFRRPRNMAYRSEARAPPRPMHGPRSTPAPWRPSQSLPYHRHQRHRGASRQPRQSAPASEAVTRRQWLQRSPRRLLRLATSASGDGGGRNPATTSSQSRRKQGSPMGSGCWKLHRRRRPCGRGGSPRAAKGWTTARTLRPVGPLCSLAPGASRRATQSAPPRRPPRRRRRPRMRCRRHPG
mmetsp:Transcript_68540/g.198885  ORF Transcript_68540/g.198885 Transcript_68540/m.198885 type:complete len:281 (+) Transcript_68540:1238-2080(+)